MRVQINRLRSKLSLYYQNGGSKDAVVIEIPGGRYAAVVRIRPAADEQRIVPETHESGVPAPVSRKRSLVVAACLAVFGLAAIWPWRPLDPARIAEAALEPIPFTTYDGWEAGPSISPDSAHLAFAWNGSKRDNTDIYVQTIGSSNPVRLTDDPAEHRRAHCSSREWTRCLP